MVYGVFAVAEDSENNCGGNDIRSMMDKDSSLKALNDSKQLTASKRFELFRRLLKSDYSAFAVKFIKPTFISAESFRRSKVSLNQVSHTAVFELIQGLIDRKVTVKKVFVDTVGPMDKYQRLLEAGFPDLAFKVDKKADAKYKPVSGASVLAKVFRDAELQYLSRNTKVSSDWGSGYPSDPMTKKYLRQTVDPVFGFNNVVRNSWSTASTLLEKYAVQVQWEEEEKQREQSITKFYSKSDPGQPVTVVEKKGQFFSYRGLESTKKFF